MRGYFGVAIYHGKNAINFGTLFRTANILNASFLSVIGKRYKRQSSDTLKTDRHIPVYEYNTFEDFVKDLPYGCSLVGVEMGDRSVDLKEFKHPERAVYLLGSEDSGLPPRIMDKCHHLVKMKGDSSYNVAVAGSIVLYHRNCL